jgi:magnesium chelatase family protein
MLDRIDIQLEVPRVNYDKLSGDRLGEPSDVIRKRVQAARDIQTARFGDIRDSNIRTSNIACNADMRVAEVRKFCPVLEPGLPQAG